MNSTIKSLTFNNENIIMVENYENTIKKRKPFIITVAKRSK